MPGVEEFKLLAQQAPHQLFRFAMDWKKQSEDKSAVTHWEQREPGSLKGVLDAYAAMIALMGADTGNTELISLEIIKLIHHRCMIETMSHDPSGLVKTTIGQFRKTGANSAFGLVPETTSEAGLRSIDGNCRTICMVLLNSLLMRYGFPPSLMDDPNKFDGFSIEELVNLVKQGMTRTQELCKYVTANPATQTEELDQL